MFARHLCVQKGKKTRRNEEFVNDRVVCIFTASKKLAKLKKNLLASNFAKENKSYFG